MVIGVDKMCFVTLDNWGEDDLEGYVKYVPSSRQELQEIKGAVRYVSMRSFPFLREVVKFSYDGQEYYVDCTNFRQDHRTARLDSFIKVTEDKGEDV